MAQSNGGARVVVIGGGTGSFTLLTGASLLPANPERERMQSQETNL